MRVYQQITRCSVDSDDRLQGAVNSSLLMDLHSVLHVNPPQHFRMSFEHLLGYGKISHNKGKSTRDKNAAHFICGFEQKVKSVEEYGSRQVDVTNLVQALINFLHGNFTILKKKLLVFKMQKNK